MRHVADITVLENFDGLNASVVEVITRVVQREGKSSNPKRWVSYKGKKCYVFGLGSSYNVPKSSCISVKA